MKSLKELIGCLLLVLFSHLVFGQTTDPFETGWNFSVNGAYSNLSNASNNNGFQTIELLRVTTHTAIRSDQFIVLSPSVVLVTAGPEYIFNLQHLLSKTNFAANSSKFEGFLDAGLGTARSSVTVNGVNALSKAVFAYKIGGGFNYLLSKNVTVSPLDISYVRASLLSGHGAVYGNQVQLGAALGVRF